MNKIELINYLRRNSDRIEVSNSQMDIIQQYIEDFYDKNNKIKKEELIDFLAKNNDRLEMGNSQFDILCDLIYEVE